MADSGGAVRRLKEGLKSLPLIREWRRRRQLAHFFSPKGFASFYGVFQSFEEARRFLPPNEEFDQELLAQSYEQERLGRVFGNDYPAMFWLGAAFRAGKLSVLDIGGSIGVHYYAYARYLSYPAGLTWEVCETPAVARRGRELAQREQAGALRFSEALEPRNMRAQVWFSAGTIQYLEHGHPAALLAACPERPSFVILNKLPLHEGEDFVTTQNIIDRMYAPQYVFNRKRFIGDIEAAGYRLEDAWDVADREFWLPGHPELSFGRFSGLCFVAR